MTLERIKAVFAALPNCAAWSLQLLKINTSKQNRTSYTGREIALSPEGTLTTFVAEISDRYIICTVLTAQVPHNISAVTPCIYEIF